jgi:tetratricopeptide (TPR) repeat protein
LFQGWFRKAQALQELGRFQEATGAWKKAAGLDPANADFANKARECELKWKKDLSQADLLKEEGNEVRAFPKRNSRFPFCSLFFFFPLFVQLFKVGKIQQAVDAYTK